MSQVSLSLDNALIDTVERGDELILRAQALAHHTEEQLQALTGSEQPYSSATAITAPHTSLSDKSACSTMAQVRQDE